MEAGCISNAERAEFAAKQIDSNQRYLYQTADGDNPKVSRTNYA